MMEYFIAWLLFGWLVGEVITVSHENKILTRMLSDNFDTLSERIWVAYMIMVLWPIWVYFDITGGMD